jgi:hypothetical protein
MFTVIVLVGFSIFRDVCWWGLVFSGMCVGGV